MNNFYRRHLPHFVQEGYAYFITARLKGSLPTSVIDQLKRKHANDLGYLSGMTNSKKKFEKMLESRERYFHDFDSALIKFSNGPYWLKNLAVAKMVADSLLYRNENIYNLYAYTIMPNHIHLIIKPINQIKDAPYTIAKIMQSLKRHTAKEANKILKREGSFWQQENYDHVIRNRSELIKLVDYILNNPVKAGFTDNSENWEWNFYDPKLLSL